jgi:hypothetical protein
MSALALTEEAALHCAHGARVALEHSQDFVRIAGRPALVEGDLMGRTVRGCSTATITSPPCTLTVRVTDAPSHSAFVRIAGRRLCLGTAEGTTNWGNLTTTPWGTTAAGQDFVRVGG